MLRRRENTASLDASPLGGIRVHKFKVMDVHPSRSAAICLHRMTAINHPLFARGNRTASVGTFLD